MRDVELYELVQRGTPGDIAFYQRICQGALRVLELGACTGRVASALARAGHYVSALDIDPEALKLGQARHADLGERLTFLRGDMATFSLQQTFDAVLVPFGGLYCLLDAPRLRRCLSCIRKHLAPQGLLAFDAYFADSLQSEPASAKYGEAEHLVTVEHFGDVIDVVESSTHAPKAQRLDAKYQYCGRGSGVRRELVIQQRYLLAHQVVPLLNGAGFKLRMLAGDFDGSPMTPESEQLVVVAEPLHRLDSPAHTPTDPAKSGRARRTKR